MGKPLLILGGALYALPVISAAHELGIEAYTCDYLPDNPAHKVSDGYINASIVDREAVLTAATSINAGGIMSFAADPGVVSAAYVAEKMGLPFQGSFEAISILQDKQRFRTFLRDNGFNCPSLYFFSSGAEAERRADELPYPMIAKPVDSAGSKGCRRVDSACELKAAVEYALEYSRCGKCIVEQFLDKQCESSDSDSFLVNGTFQCVSFTAQLFDKNVSNPYTPAAYMMPSVMPDWAQKEIRSELQRMAGLLGLKDGIFNVETRVATDGKAYIMECAPRGGGNRLAEMLRFATSGKTDLIRASVQAAMGLQIDAAKEAPLDGFWYQQMLHSKKDGVYKGVRYAKGFFEEHVVDEQIWTEEGMRVKEFSSANFAFGSLIMRFETKEELIEFENNGDKYVQVNISE